MKRTFILLTVAAWLLIPCLQIAHSQTKTAPQPQTMEAPAFLVKTWTGDLDELRKRRVIRVLTVYSKTFYFVDKGQPRGIVYDAMKEFENTLNKKLKTGNMAIHFIFIPVERDRLLPWLLEGRGDIAAANLTITPEREKTVDFTDSLYQNVNEIVLTGPASPQLATVDDLAGKEVYVRKSSSYYESLTALNAEFKKQGKPEVILKVAPENLENEDLIEMLNAGLVKILVVDQHIATFWKQIFPKVALHPDLVLRKGGDIGWAFRKDSPLLKAELNEFIATRAKGTAFGNTLLQRYLKSVKYVKSATSDAEMKKFEQTVELLKKYSGKYSVDTLLMAAQGYQESRLDQNAKSQVGAIGVMQVMPATGKDMNVGDITQIDANIHAGVKYMRFMMDQYYKNEPMDDFNKLIFTFASYNAGPGRIRQLRRMATEKGYDPNIWFGNVERIAAEKIGHETVTYVSNIYKYYLAYKLIEEDRLAREAVKQKIQ